MGRRRRRVVKLPKKQLPKIFLCPSCGKESVTVEVMKDRKLAQVTCNKCNIFANVPISPADQNVDIYCKFTDNFYTGS